MSAGQKHLLPNLGVGADNEEIWKEKAECIASAEEAEPLRLSLTSVLGFVLIQRGWPGTAAISPPDLRRAGHSPLLLIPSEKCAH